MAEQGGIEIRNLTRCVVERALKAGKDGLAGFPDAVGKVCPNGVLQLSSRNREAGLHIIGTSSTDIRRKKRKQLMI